MLALDFAQARVHDRFFAPLFRTVRNGPDEETLRASLLEFMDSKRVNDRTDDDKTLLLATRNTCRCPGKPTRRNCMTIWETRSAPRAKPFAVGGEGAVFDVQGQAQPGREALQQAAEQGALRQAAGDGQALRP